MDFQNNIKMKMFSGLWFLNLWVKLNHFHTAVDIPHRNIHKYQALQNIMSESKGRSYPAVQIKAVITVHKKLSACCFKVIFFLMYWLQKRRKFSISRCNYMNLQQNKEHHKSQNWLIWRIRWQQNFLFPLIQSKSLPNKSLIT